MGSTVLYIILTLIRTLHKSETDVPFLWTPEIEAASSEDPLINRELFIKGASLNMLLRHPEI